MKLSIDQHIALVDAWNEIDPPVPFDQLPGCSTAALPTPSAVESLHDVVKSIPCDEIRTHLLARPGTHFPEAMGYGIPSPIASFHQMMIDYYGMIAADPTLELLNHYVSTVNRHYSKHEMVHLISIVQCAELPEGELLYAYASKQQMMRLPLPRATNNPFIRLNIHTSNKLYPNGYFSDVFGSAIADTKLIFRDITGKAPRTERFCRIKPVTSQNPDNALRFYLGLTNPTIYAVPEAEALERFVQVADEE